MKGAAGKRNMIRAGRRRMAAGLVAAMAVGMAGVTAAASESRLPGGKEVYNLLLIGTDHRDESWNGNSDVMMVASINSVSEKITLVSFMRDLYADIPGYGAHKLNYAFAVGGAALLEETLEDNYEFEVDNYAVVDFESMAEVVDAVGGVEITVSAEECEWLNGYLKSMEAEEDFLPGEGTYVLNGNQAVAYMRIRFVGNSDYERTQRQRDVLKEIFSSMNQLKAEELTNLAEEVLTEVDHNVGPIQMLQLMASLPDLAGYELAESRIPYDDLYHSENEMLVPDFGATIERLHDTLYSDIQ